MTTLWTRRFIILLLCETSFALSFSSFLLLPKYLTQEFDATPAQLGAVSACFGITAFLFTPLVGVWVDRLRRRPFALAGALLMALTAAGFLFVETLGVAFYGLRLLQGVAFAFSFIACATLVTDQAPQERISEAIGLFGISFQAMHGVAPPMVEWIVAHYSWDYAFGMAVAAALLSALTVFAIHEGPSPEREEEAPGLLQVARRAGMLRNVSVVALCGAAFAGMMIYHQPWALEQGIQQVGSFFAAFSVASIMIRVFFGHLADRWGRYPVSMASLGLYGLVVLAMLGLGPGGLPLLGLGFGVAHGFFYPALNGVALEGVGPAERGKVVALLNGAFNGGFTLGTACLGLLAQRAGLPQVFVAAALACGLGVLLLALFRGADRHPQGVVSEVEA